MSLIFHCGLFLLLHFSFFFAPLLAMLFPVIFTGRQITVTLGKKLLKTMGVILGLTVLGMLIFSERYTTSLIDKGYIECLGIPSGWMPGMATRYVKNIKICSQQLPE